MPITERELREAYGRKREQRVPRCPLCGLRVTSVQAFAVAEGRMCHAPCAKQLEDMAALAARTVASWQVAAKAPAIEADVCVWCNRPLEPGNGVIELAGRKMHDGNGPNCRAEFDAHVYGGG